VLIYPRRGFEVDATSLPDRVELVDTPLIEVSSTFIRQALKEGKDVRYFLHPAVYEALKGTGR
jgi:nicotinate-nucleotide adenylyltransferase